MEELQKQLEAKRLAQGQGKYVKRGDLEKQKREQFQQSKARIVSSPELKRKLVVEPLAVEPLVEVDIPEEELVKRFRARNEPIRLFGESQSDRLKRLKAIESSEERTEGQRNDFKSLMQATDRELAEKHLRQKDGPLIESDKKQRKIAEQDSADTSIISLALLKMDPDLNGSLLSIYFKRMLREWDKYLDARTDEQRRTVQGKLATATHAQATEYLKPFFRHIKKKDLPIDVMARITEIVFFLQKREYMMAQDSYMKLSIGNAPWPIGVTSVGLHERSNEDKIATSQVAHALNDETQRKWIQSVKRIMTFAQILLPPDDVSKLVG